jgi:ribosomal protein L16 Arg81 hydroxylase
VTTTSQQADPARAGEHRALRRLIAAEPETFAERYWGTEPLLSRAAELPGSFDDLFSPQAVDELVSTRGLRTPFLRMARNGTTLADGAFTRPGGVGAGISDQASDDDILRELADGATLVLQGLHRTWEPVAAFAQALAADLGHPTQVNAYITPPQNTGFSDHYDVHDVFVLQVAGEKLWRVRPPVLWLPLRTEPWTDRRTAVEAAAATSAPLLETTLSPGDCLYLPRGYLHAATALGGTSTHLTIGVHPWTRRHLVDELVNQALDLASRDPAVRAPLPLGTDLTDPAAHAADVELVRAALVRAIEQVPARDLVTGLSRAARSAQRAAPLAPLAQAAAASRLTAEDRIGLRPHLAPQLVPAEDGSAVLLSRAGRMALSADERVAVERLLERGTVRAGDLGVETSRRLMLGGVAVPA